jgi:hypothetical protein
MLERERLLAEAARCRIAVVGMRDAAAADGVPPDRAP